MKRTLVLFAVLLLLAGCSRAPGPEPEQPSVSPAKTAPVAAKAGLASLFPEGDWSATYNFDDATQETTEWWLRDGERIISANANGVYAVWQMTEVGLFRRDPFGGADAPFLLFLPADLKTPSAWQQSSNGVPVSFRLRRAVVCGDHPDEAKARGANCWQLEMLNRNRILRLYFQEGKGAVGASLLNLGSPAESYHKQARDQQRATPAPPVSRPTWLAAANKQPAFIPEAVPPITALTPEQFEGALSGAVKAATTPVQLAGPAPYYLAGALGTPLNFQTLLLTDNRAERWERLNPSLSPCTYRLQSKPGAFLIELCGTPTSSGASVTSAMMVRAWAYGTEGPIRLQWPQKPAQTGSKEGMRITMDAAGDVTVVRAMGDPVRHVETSVYRVNGGSFTTVTQAVTKAADSQYPQKPEDVLLAALFARHHNLNDELPSFFATKGEAERLLRFDYKKVVGLEPDKLDVGPLEKASASKHGEAPVKAVPQAPQPGKPTGFVMHASGCCDSFTNLWGSVTFTVDEHRLWKIERLDLQQVQDLAGTRSVAPAP